MREEFLHREWLLVPFSLNFDCKQLTTSSNAAHRFANLTCVALFQDNLVLDVRTVAVEFLEGRHFDGPSCHAIG